MFIRLQSQTRHIAVDSVVVVVVVWLWQCCCILSQPGLDIDIMLIFTTLSVTAVGSLHFAVVAAVV